MQSNWAVHFTVSRNSLPYLLHSVTAYSNLKSELANVKYFAYCLDEFCQKALKKKSIFEQVYLVSLSTISGSVGHAIAVETAFKNFQPEHFNIISDTDIYLMLRGWDVTISRMFEDQTIDIIGTQHEGIGGYISGFLQLQQYKNKPSTTWMAFNLGVVLPDLSVMPDKQHVIRIDTEYLANLYGLPLGYELFKDTGWQIPSYLEDHQLNFRILDLVKPTSNNAKVLHGLNSYHDEFHFNNEPFLIHQRGSMTHKFRIGKLSRNFYLAGDKYLNYPKWSKPPTKIDIISAFPEIFWKIFKKFLRRIRTYRINLD